MREQSVIKTYANTVKTYIADDGTEFDSKEKCIVYENEIFFNSNREKYNIKNIVTLPSFICTNNDVNVR